MHETMKIQSIHIQKHPIDLDRFTKRWTLHVGQQALGPLPPLLMRLQTTVLRQVPLSIRIDRGLSSEAAQRIASTRYSLQRRPLRLVDASN